MVSEFEGQPFDFVGVGAKKMQNIVQHNLPRL